MLCSLAFFVGLFAGLLLAKPALWEAAKLLAQGAVLMARLRRENSEMRAYLDKAIAAMDEVIPILQAEKEKAAP